MGAPKQVYNWLFGTECRLVKANYLVHHDAIRRILCTEQNFLYTEFMRVQLVLNGAPSDFQD